MILYIYCTIHIFLSLAIASWSLIRPKSKRIKQALSQRVTIHHRFFGQLFFFVSFFCAIVFHEHTAPPHRVAAAFIFKTECFTVLSYRSVGDGLYLFNDFLVILYFLFFFFFISSLSLSSSPNVALNSLSEEKSVASFFSSCIVLHQISYLREYISLIPAWHMNVYIFFE